MPSCKIEPGWDCEVAGELCVPHCGDGMIVGDEECEFYDGATPAAGNGCGTDCRVEPGWDCNSVAKTCAKTVCGDGVVERGEQCDDKNSVPFDGCYNCLAEPSCNGGTCQAVCGDGKRYGSEACDDGNIRDGDGCSHDCKVEDGYKCTDIVPAAADKLSLPVIHRDFVGLIKGGETATTRANPALAAARTAAGVLIHPDFNVFPGGGGVRGVVKSQLGADGLPEYVTPNNPAEPSNFTGKANFDKWYRNDPVYNRTVISAIDLTRNGASTPSTATTQAGSSDSTAWGSFPRSTLTRNAAITTSRSRPRHAFGSSTAAARRSIFQEMTTFGCSSTTCWSSTSAVCTLD